ncbi:hypothetical protein GCM10027580_28070 [Corynebacterium faecale]|uniref:hypothetical protein n=1 Tax=Corynebacterium faecale TaxID=1758466 RepID=UPI0025B4ED3A|nr:hypothetical protein [Corynebacterium faecale]
MKLAKRVGATSAALMLSFAVLFPATASAAASWNGPFNSMFTCLLHMKIPRLDAGANFPNIRGCEMHDDGKYWYLL